MTIALSAVAWLDRGRIHPWLHADRHGVIVGRMTNAQEHQLIASDGTALTLPPDSNKKPAVPLAFVPQSYPDLADRWSDEDAEAWLANPEPPGLSEALALCRWELLQAVEFSRKEHAALIAVWALATYFHPWFLTFPRLSLSGERGCGKSKVLTLLRAVCWNAVQAVAPTPAVIFRLVDSLRPTLLLDEMEALDREDRAEILGIINVGYKRGAKVPRVEGERTRSIRTFEVYAPMALAAIREPHATTADRCLSLVMRRGAETRKINAEVDPDAPAFARIRAMSHRALLAHWQTIQNAYQDVPLPPWLTARARELWRPLLAMAYAADQEAESLGIMDELLGLARAHVADREDMSAEGQALLTVLGEHVTDGADTIVHPGDLADPLRTLLGWRDAPTPEQIGQWLRRYGVPKARPPRDKQGVRYALTRACLDEVRIRYAPGQAEVDAG